jgi:hypothetical protein
VLLITPLNPDVTPTNAPKNRRGLSPLGNTRSKADVNPSRCCTVPAKIVKTKIVSKLLFPSVDVHSSSGNAPTAHAATTAPENSTDGRIPRQNTPRTTAP